MIKITENKTPKATVFGVEGRLDGQTSLELEKTILSAIDEGTSYIVLDFHALNYISSAGIRTLLLCYKELEKKEGLIFLASVPKPIENILYITGFLPYFKVFDEPGKALAAL